MPKQDGNLPIYYDGSAHVEFSEELSDVPQARPDEGTVDKEEWRRFIGANPYEVHVNR